MSQIIDLGKLRFHFAGDWVANVYYEPNDVVKYGGNVYVYTYTLKTQGVLPTTNTHWALMVEGFKFRGVHSTATAYKIGDGVAHGGKVYICVQDNVNQTPPNVTYWSQFADGVQYEGEYDNLRNYQKNDIVIYGANVYIARTDMVGVVPTVTANWDRMVDGISAEGVYNSGTTYLPGDLVAYGANIYRCHTTTTNNLPTNASYWVLFLRGGQYTGQWSVSTPYLIGQTVLYGGSQYFALRDSLGATPSSSPSDWLVSVPGYTYLGNWSSVVAYKKDEVITYGGSQYIALRDNNNATPSTLALDWGRSTPGFAYLGNWTAAVEYKKDEVVTYGGNSYICLVTHISLVFATDLLTTKWQKFNSGIRYRNSWTGTTQYLKDDVVKSGISTYICLVDHTSTTNFITDKNAGNWDFLAQGAEDVLPPRTSLDLGKLLTILPGGTEVGWVHTTALDKILYVAPHGQDVIEAGLALNFPCRTLRYAASRALALGGGCTIFVSTGTYEELLPITIPENTAVVGDNQRTTIIKPIAGLNFAGTAPNNETTMFLLSNGSILNKMTFQGLTGWVPGTTPANITTSTIKGVVVAFNPASPVTTKLPYVLECAAIGLGLVGAFIDGAVHASGFKSMLFHGYTIILDSGVGYYTKDSGRAEIVSCFTYYCYFGYVSSGGGIIRALNGNNSYGMYGAYSLGFDSTETPITGQIHGNMLEVVLVPNIVLVSDTIVGATSGATGTVLNVQYAAQKIYYSPLSGLFLPNEDILLGVAGPVISTIVTGGVTAGQKGVLLVLNNLLAEPKPGMSISLTGDINSYVIQSTQGTYVNTSSVIAVVLVQDKPTALISGTGAQLRLKYSQIRLTGHDFLNIGTGGVVSTNYPNTPLQPALQANEVVEDFPGRVYYVSTDQNGNFRVGEFFKIDQGTGRATLNASAFDLSGLTSLRLGSIGAQLGESINEFSSDITLGGNSNIAVPTERAVKTYVDDLVNTTSFTLYYDKGL